MSVKRLSGAGERTAFSSSLCHRLFLQPLASSFLQRIRSVPAPTPALLSQSIDSHPHFFGSSDAPSHCNATILYSELSSSSSPPPREQLKIVVEIKFFVENTIAFFQHCEQQHGITNSRLCVTNYPDVDEQNHVHPNTTAMQYNLVPRWLVEDIAEVFRASGSGRTKEELEESVKVLFDADSVSVQSVFVSGTEAEDSSRRCRLNVFHCFSLLLEYENLFRLLPS